MISLVYLGYHLFRHWSLSLENQVQKATQANEAKSQLLSRMTHELRTPLNAIIGLTRLALGSTLTQSQREHINKIRTSASLLNSVINELLDYSKIEANKLELEFTAFALEEVVNRVAGILSPRCSEKKIAFIVDLSPDIPRFILGDPLRVEQILLNLLSNAIKFTDRGHVLLRITSGQQNESQFKLYFEIIDTGTGIDAAQIPNLFQPFKQSDKSISRRFGGTGLGLAISQQLVGLMGGEIQVSSEVGVGTEFVFSLLVGFRPDSMSGNIGFVCHKSWLLLHNQPEIAAILDDRLRRIGGSVNELGHEQAIQEWLNGGLSRTFSSPDLLLISHRIGAMDGITLLRKLRSMPAWKTTPVLFLYPQSEEENYRTLVNEDPYTELLPLPFYGAMFCNAIMSVLGLGARTSITRLPAHDWRNMLHEINVLLVEDNAIGTEYLRADLLAEKDAVKVRTMLKDYVDLRILFYTTRDKQEVQKINDRTAKLQAELWATVREPAKAQPIPTVTLTVSGMNDVLNSQAYSQAAWWNRIPVMANVLMTLIAMFGNLMFGYASRNPESENRLFLILPLIISISFLLVMDIDSPNWGIIRVVPDNLISLAASLNGK